MLEKYMGMARNFVEKHSAVCLIMIFILCIALNMLVVTKITIPAYAGHDEDIYINMARSFFYEGNFSKGYQILNYSCVLYSMLISVAYFVYSPQGILLIMRMIGIIVISSSVFPAYLLAKKVFGSKIKALGVALFTIMIPEMLLSLYVVQENLSYPLFLWIAYLVYNKFTMEKSTKRDLMIIILLVLIFFTKSYTIAFAGAYFLCLMMFSLKEPDRGKQIKNIIIQGLIFVGMIVLGYLIIYVINDFQQGTNHYDSQIMGIFPLTPEKIVAFFYGIFGYIVFTLFSFGILPVLLPLFNINEYSTGDRKFIWFLAILTVLTAIEIAFVVYIPEEARKTFPIKSMC